MQRDLFSDRIVRVPTVASDEAGGLPSYLEPDDATLVWQSVKTLARNKRWLNFAKRIGIQSTPMCGVASLMFMKHKT